MKRQGDSSTGKAKGYSSQERERSASVKALEGAQSGSAESASASKLGRSSGHLVEGFKV